MCTKNGNANVSVCSLLHIGLIRQPKYGHLKQLHKAIKLCEPALISADPIVTQLGDRQQVSTLPT